MLVEFTHASLAFLSGKSRSLKKIFATDIILTADMCVPTTLLIDIKPIKSSLTSLLMSHAMRVAQLM